MLTPDEIQKIKEQETIRLQLQRELTPERRRGIWELLNSQFALWLLGSVLLSGITYYWNHRNDQRLENEKHLEQQLVVQREDSQFLIQLLPSLTSSDRNVQLRAVDVIKTRYPEDKFPAAIQRLIANIVVEASAQPNAQQPDETKRLIASAARTLDRLPEQDPAVASAIQQLPARVYLQIFDEQDRAKAKQIQSGLRQQGFIAPGIENVGNKAQTVKQTEIRFFNDSDKDSANKVRDILNQSGIGQVQILQLQIKTKVSPGTIEVWLAASV